MPPQISTTGPSPSTRAGAENPTTSHGKIAGLPPAFVLRQNPDPFPRSTQRYARLDGLSESAGTAWRPPPVNPGHVPSELLVSTAANLPVSDAALREIAYLPSIVQEGIVSSLARFGPEVDDNDVTRATAGWLAGAQNPGAGARQSATIITAANEPPPDTIPALSEEASDLEETTGEGDPVYDTQVARLREAVERQDLRAAQEAWLALHSENTTSPPPKTTPDQPDIAPGFLPSFIAEPFDYQQVQPSGTDYENPYD